MVDAAQLLHGIDELQFNTAPSREQEFGERL